MDTRNWIPLMAVVLFLGASFPAEACRCRRSHLQSSYCNSNAVLKVKFLEATTRTVPGSQDVQQGYKVKVERVFKGKVPLKSLTFIIDSMSGTSCEYFHPSTDFHKDYLIAASSKNNSGVSVNSCSYTAPWSKLSIKQKKGVAGVYNKGCTCDISYCSSKPCAMAQKTCTIDEYIGGDAENQLKNLVCVPFNSTTCKWKKIE